MESRFIRQLNYWIGVLEVYERFLYKPFKNFFGFYPFAYLMAAWRGASFLQGKSPQGEALLKRLEPFREEVLNRMEEAPEDLEDREKEFVGFIVSYLKGENPDLEPFKGTYLTFYLSIVEDYIKEYEAQEKAE